MSNAAAVGTAILTSAQKMIVVDGTNVNVALKNFMTCLIELGSSDNNKKIIIEELKSLAKTIQDKVNNGEQIGDDVANEMKNKLNINNNSVKMYLSEIIEGLRKICDHQKFGVSLFGFTMYTSTAEIVLKWLNDEIIKIGNADTIKPFHELLSPDEMKPESIEESKNDALKTKLNKLRSEFNSLTVVGAESKDDDMESKGDNEASGYSTRVEAFLKNYEVYMEFARKRNGEFLDLSLIIDSELFETLNDKVKNKILCLRDDYILQKHFETNSYYIENNINYFSGKKLNDILIHTEFSKLTDTIKNTIEDAFDNSIRFEQQVSVMLLGDNETKSQNSNITIKGALESPQFKLLDRKMQQGLRYNFVLQKISSILNPTGDNETKSDTGGNSDEINTILNPTGDNETKSDTGENSDEINTNNNDFDYVMQCYKEYINCAISQDPKGEFIDYEFIDLSNLIKFLNKKTIIQDSGNQKFHANSSALKAQIIQNHYIMRNIILTKFPFGYDNFNLLRINKGFLQGKEVFNGEELFAIVESDSFKSIGDEYRKGIETEYKEYKKFEGKVDMILAITYEDISSINKITDIEHSPHFNQLPEITQKNVSASREEIIQSRRENFRKSFMEEINAQLLDANSLVDTNVQLLENKNINDILSNIFSATQKNPSLYKKCITIFLDKYVECINVIGDQAMRFDVDGELKDVDLNPLITDNFQLLYKQQRCEIYRLLVYCESVKYLNANKNAGADDLMPHMDTVLSSISSKLSHISTFLGIEFAQELITMAAETYFLLDYTDKNEFSARKQSIKSRVFIRDSASVSEPFLKLQVFGGIPLKYHQEYQIKSGELKYDFFRLDKLNNDKNSHDVNIVKNRYNFEISSLKTSSFDEIDFFSAEKNIVRIFGNSRPAQFLNYNRKHVSQIIATQWIIQEGVTAFDQRGQFRFDGLKTFLLSSKNIELRKLANLLSKDDFKGISLLLNKDGEFSILFPQAHSIFSRSKTAKVVELSQALNAKFIQQQKEQVIDCMLKYFPS